MDALWGEEAVKVVVEAIFPPVRNWQALVYSILWEPDSLWEKTQQSQVIHVGSWRSWELPVGTLWTLVLHGYLAPWDKRFDKASVASTFLSLGVWWVQMHLVGVRFLLPHCLDG